MPQVRHLKLPIGILRPYISLLRPQLRLLKAFSQPSIASHPLLQAGPTKVSLCSPHSNSQSLKAGQRVLLTTYCPWATCFTSFLLNAFDPLFNCHSVICSVSLLLYHFLTFCLSYQLRLYPMISWQPSWWIQTLFHSFVHSIFSAYSFLPRIFSCLWI